MSHTIVDPSSAFAQAIALQNDGFNLDALALYDALLAQYNCSADVHYRHGFALFEQGRYTEAATSFTRVIEQTPNADAYVSRGSAHTMLMQFNEALADYAEALALQPKWLTPHINKGLVYFELGHLNQALECFEQALVISPNDQTALWKKAWCLLCAGNLQQGLSQYERVSGGHIRHPHRAISYGGKPCFLGAATELVGKTVLLWLEGGSGDVMQFCRYALVLEQLGVRVILEVARPLLRLMQTSFANTSIRVAVAGEVGADEFDFHTSMMSLPLICGTNTPEEIPARRPYLFAEAQDVLKMAFPGTTTRVLRIGLVWSGEARLHPDEQRRNVARSYPLQKLASIFDLAGSYKLTFFNLQMGEPANQLQTWPNFPLIDLTPHLDDWADTAALVANLDLVITCCTGVAHLAGAMGTPTWVLLHHEPCWRWFKARSDSPWYPTVRLFRQPSRGDWDSVMNEVHTALKELVGRTSMSEARMTDVDPFLEIFRRLKMGDFANGWPLHEQRWQAESMTAAAAIRAQRDFQVPIWLGQESLAGKTIFIWPEQGHGDVMQFVRYVNEVASRAEKVLLAAHTSTIKLLAQSLTHPNIDVVLDLEEHAYQFDFHCPIMSLPLACGTDSLEKIPAHTPYLFADQQEASAWRERINAISPRAISRVGLVWAGGARLAIDPERSLMLSHFEPLVALIKNGGAGEVQLFSLQVGEVASQLQAAPDFPIIDLTGNLKNWADTAALLANLDLVITVDTAVAHLAAAMGKPTWILSRHNGCWRWLENRDDSPWYPTVRLFRQKQRGDWDGVMAEVALALASYNA